MDQTAEGTYRLLTRSDFDGLVCAVLLREKGLVDEITFVHPKDMQDGLIPVTDRDITTNLPYVPGVYLAFDHHVSETLRVGPQANHIIDPQAPSAARVVYDYYGGSQAFPAISQEMMDAVDKGDSAQFTLDEVLNPQGWVLLNFIMDARTGLGRFKNFRISNYQLMMDLIDYCRDHSIEEILALRDVKERVDLYFEHQNLFREQLKRCAVVHENVLVINLKDEDPIYAGNRFVKYALFPDTSVSIQIVWGFQRRNTVFSVGRSIFNRSSQVNIGELMLRYGGGGHAAAGTCQIDGQIEDEVLKDLIQSLHEE
ncbi:exopolyphosphatase [Spirochaeta lutea]|uniref:Exopolyphosphatase n=1 Tax=Spirochaeta lutea TaxID=1480694 RepID=A0A098QZJ2_9SPIO|nr:exopolyphosphatase [Spirochaeta lutea]KGE72838.1 exopolyphosphatase [Spirochaeta lutea]